MIKGDGNLIAIANLCKNLETINLAFTDIRVSQQEFEQFAMAIGPKLTYCELFLMNDTIDNFTFSKILCKNFKNIEELDFFTEDKQQDKQLFYYLNKCKNLKKLSWNYFSDNKGFDHQIDSNDQNMIGVLQRINSLETDSTLKNQLDNFKLNLKCKIKI